MAETADDNVQTEIGYFSRDSLYDAEKPYTTSFPVDSIHDPNAKVDNHKFELHPARVRNARHALNPSLGVHGFQFLPCTTTLARADFNSSETIATRYYSELATLLSNHFPQYKRVAFFDHAVRCNPFPCDSDPPPHFSCTNVGLVTSDSLATNPC